jgi:hypothetical protein
MIILIGTTTTLFLTEYYNAKDIYYDLREVKERCLNGKVEKPYSATCNTGSQDLKWPIFSAFNKVKEQFSICGTTSCSELIQGFINSWTIFVLTIVSLLIFMIIYYRTLFYLKKKKYRNNFIPMTNEYYNNGLLASYLSRNQRNEHLLIKDD